jgi:hypothetical protein
VKGLQVNNVVLKTLNPDERPAFVLDDVHDASFSHVDAQKQGNTPVFILKNVTGITTHEVKGVEDIKIKKAENQKL